MDTLATQRPGAVGEPQAGVSFEFDGLYLRVRDAAGRLKPLPQEADMQLLERDADLQAARALLRERDTALQEQAAIIERLRILARAGDLAALQALLDQPSGRDDPSSRP